MKKAGSRILIITFGIMAAIAILYPWKFVPEYGILQMTESGEKAGKTAESQESDEEYMQVADRAVEALFTGDTDTLLMYHSNPVFIWCFKSYLLPLTAATCI